MKLQHILTGAALVMSGLIAPQIVSASVDTTLFGLNAPMSGKAAAADDGSFEISRRGRGRGGDDRGGDNHGGRSGSDDSSSDDSNSGDTSGSGRSKPRIPGGSGCDDAGDMEEHGGCRG